MSHFVSAWAPDVLDAGGEHEYDEPAPKKQNVHRSFQKAPWLMLFPWLIVVANDSAVECSRTSVGCPGCADCSKMFCQMCAPRSTGACENLSYNQFNDGGCSRFRLGAIRDHRDLYRSGDLDQTQPDLIAVISRMTGDHKGKTIGIMANVYYLAKKKNPLNHINDLCDHTHEAVRVGWQAPHPHLRGWVGRRLVQRRVCTYTYDNYMFVPLTVATTIHMLQCACLAAWCYVCHEEQAPACSIIRVFQAVAQRKAFVLPNHTS